MENREFFKRIEELADRCERTSVISKTVFLTPAEQYELSAWAAYHPDCHLLFSGGREGCERKAAFFLPYYLEEKDFDAREYIQAVKIKALFGVPSHRDYMGATLGLGIRREWLGDFWVFDDIAYVFCLPSVRQLLLDNLTKVGQTSVMTTAVHLEQIPAKKIKTKKVNFTVKSLRLDAVLGPMFGLSRSAAADLIRTGAASLNYSTCLHVDAPVKEGDIIALRGHGKGSVLQTGGKSRKGRLFLETEIYL